MAYTTKEIEEIVYNFLTNYKEGFTDDELKLLVDQFDNFSLDKFNDAMFGNTCMVIDQKIINYHCDVYSAICCGTENRDLKVGEYD